MSAKMKKRRFDDWKIGDIVYQSSTPQNPAKILNITLDPIRFPNQNWKEYTLHVLTIKGNIEQWSHLHVRDFNALIEDHEHKLNFHKKSLEKLHEKEKEKNNQGT